jgi:hypothetical protein
LKDLGHFSLAAARKAVMALDARANVVKRGVVKRGGLEALVALGEADFHVQKPMRP